MALGQVKRPLLGEQVVALLRDEIVSGRWPVGDRIPPEQQLMASLEVARSTLREALGALQYSGLIEIRRGDGTFVRAASELPGALARSPARLADIQEARTVLEPVLAAMAAERADEAAAERLERALGARVAMVEATAEEWVEADMEVHLAIAEAAGNPILTELYSALLPRLREAMLEEVNAVGFRRDEPRGHEEVLEAIRCGDPRAAADSVRANLDGPR